ncbi:hypothetical protein NDN08_002486 [Rhodosorus marinus]|uniref:Uncharacterized protein n=1 Tax=Rhodosorus marinus TaxID=101924 RepID=A0AAV8UTV4_9RHOD|nr:hypothetical protein NDN08_002486 [Rhodosorus marinus]
MAMDVLFVVGGGLHAGRARSPLRDRKRSIVCTIGGFVDENQFTLRERKRRVLAEEFGLDKLQTQLHTHVFVRDELDDAFLDGLHRHCRDIRAGEGGGHYLLMALHVADPSWGGNRGIPPPHPRFMLVEDDVAEDTKTATSQWIELLGDALGSRLLRDETHTVPYKRVRRFGDPKLGLKPERDEDELVLVVEVTNADWTSKEKISGLSNLLMQRGHEMIDQKRMLWYEVLQSESEPSVFKTLELYATVDDLMTTVEETDEEYSKQLESYKAAVARVRQAFRIIRP